MPIPKHIRRPIGQAVRPEPILPPRPKPDPCPFCGGATIEPRYTRSVYAYMVCLSCKAQGPTVGGGKGVASIFATEAWNRRAAPVARPKRALALKPPG